MATVRRVDQIVLTLSSDEVNGLLRALEMWGDRVRYDLLPSDATEAAVEAICVALVDAGLNG